VLHHIQSSYLSPPKPILINGLLGTYLDANNRFPDVGFDGTSAPSDLEIIFPNGKWKMENGNSQLYTLLAGSPQLWLLAKLL